MRAPLVSPTDRSWQPGAAARPPPDSRLSPLLPIPLLVPRDLLHDVVVTVPMSTTGGDSMVLHSTTSIRSAVKRGERALGRSRRPPDLNEKSTSLSWRRGVLSLGRMSSAALVPPGLQ